MHLAGDFDEEGLELVYLEYSTDVVKKTKKISGSAKSKLHHLYYLMNLTQDVVTGKSMPGLPMYLIVGSSLALLIIAIGAGVALYKKK